MKPPPSPPLAHLADRFPHGRLPSLAEMTARNVETILSIERAADATKSRADIVSSAIARFCGSITFVALHVTFFVGWMLYNTLPGFRHFDPYPFTFLTLMLSIEAIFLSAFIMISQNLDARISDRRNHLDLQVNLLAEQENTKMLLLLSRIAERVGAEVDDPAVEALAEATSPEQMMKQIERCEQKLADAVADGVEKTVETDDGAAADPNAPTATAAPR